MTLLFQCSLKSSTSDDGDRNWRRPGATGRGSGSAAEQPGGVPAVAARGSALPFENRAVAAAAAEGARTALATAEPAAYGAAHRVLADGLGPRIERGDVRSGQAALSGDVSGAAEIADAAVRKDRPGERVSAQPHFDAVDEIGRGVFRTVPLARLGGAVRGAISGPVPDAAVPGRFGANDRASGLHLRRDGDVPAAVPAGGGRGGIRARGGARGGVLGDGRAVAAGGDWAFPRPAERGDAIRGRGAATQAVRESAGGIEAARRSGARRGPAQRRGDHQVSGGRGGGDVVRARRPLAGAAAIPLRRGGRRDDLAGPQTAGEFRGRRSAQADRAGAAGVSGAGGAGGLQIRRGHVCTPV